MSLTTLPSTHSKVSLLEKQIRTNPSLKVDVLVDYFRGSRVDANGKSTISLLSSLIEKYPQQFTLSLYHTPKVTDLIKRVVPPRFIEGFGLQHMKLYIFDDSLLISGANLSSDYFTNRQDRYILIRNHALICDYFAGVFGIVSSFAYKNGKELGDVKSVSEVSKMLHDHIARYRTTNEIPASLPENTCSSSTSSSATTVICPSLQMAEFGINQEESIISRLLEYGGKNYQ